MSDGLNQARAMRVAEIINDYRTLLVHIMQQKVNLSQEEYWEEGFVVLRKALDDAEGLMSANYQPCPVTGQGNAETEKAELQRVIIDSSARRYQAHQIYLRAAAARRWAMARTNALRGQRPTVEHAPALKSATTAFHQDLARITDHYIVSDLRAADTRAGHWLNDDPSLETIHRWIATRQ